MLRGVSGRQKWKPQYLVPLPKFTQIYRRITEMQCVRERRCRFVHAARKELVEKENCSVFQRRGNEIQRRKVGTRETRNIRRNRAAIYTRGQTSKKAPDTPVNSSTDTPG